MEITVTGANALTSPSLHIWNWMVALYLFLVGVAAGLLVMSAAASLSHKSRGCLERVDSIRAATMAPFLLVLGMLFMWLDLEHKHHFYWFFLSFSLTSPMSWGGWGLTLMLPVSLLYGLSVMQDEHRHWLRFAFLKDLSRRLNPYMPMLASVCLGLGLFLGIYTGMSLSVFVARPLWNSPLLPVLFLVSALSNGAAFIIIMTRTKSAQLFFTKTAVWLIAAEIIIIALFFLGHLTSTAPQREAVMPLFTYALAYYLIEISFILIALFFPLALVLKLLGLKDDHHDRISKAVIVRMKLSAYMILAGGLIMRLAWIYLGQLSKLS